MTGSRLGDAFIGVAMILGDNNGRFPSTGPGANLRRRESSCCLQHKRALEDLKIGS